MTSLSAIATRPTAPESTSYSVLASAPVVTEPSVPAYRIHSEVATSNVLVVFDNRVQDLDTLYDALLPNAIAYTLTEQDDALTVITQLLAETGVKQLAIVAHGEPGVVQIGSFSLNQAQLQERSHLLQEWCVEAIALYSCEVAKGEGQNLIRQLGELTGATVAASTTKVGHSALKGNWNLDGMVGQFKPQSIFHLQGITRYAGILASANDNFADAVILTGNSGSVTGFDNFGATSEPGEPGQSGTINSIWFYWTAPANGMAAFDMIGSDSDPYLSVFTGSAVDSLTTIGQNDDYYGLQSYVSFNATAGTTYRIAVEGYSSSQGNISLNYSFIQANSSPALTGAAAILSNGTEDTTYTLNASELLQGFTDAEGNALSVANLTSTEGALTDNGDGTYTFNPNANYNGTVTLNYNVTDDISVTAATQTFSLTAVNDAASISGATTGSVTEDGTLTANGTLTITDPDPGETTFVVQSNVAGIYGSFGIDAAGVWSYTADNAALQFLPGGQSATDTFAVTSADGTPQTITITATGVNDAPTIGGTTTGSVTEAGTLTANGTLTIADPDTGEATFIAQSGTAGTYGSFSINAAGAWGYIADNAALQSLNSGQIANDSFTVSSVDGTPQTITITATGANNAPTIGGTITGSVIEDGILTANGTLTITDPDTEEATFVAQNDVAGIYGSFGIDAKGVWSYTANNVALQSLEAGQTANDLFTVSSADGTPQTITITATGVNDTSIVVGAIANPVAYVREAFTLSLPTDLFVDPDAVDVLTLSATLADGSSLPDWLSFDATARSFSGTPDFANAGFLSLKITATDRQGASTSGLFIVTIEQLVGDVGIPTASILFDQKRSGVNSTGTTKTDKMLGTWQNDVLKGRGGNDILKSGFAQKLFGQDRLYGEGGNDKLYGGRGKDLLDGSEGDDVLSGGNGRDLLRGGGGRDRLFGGRGDDFLVGGSGNDALTGNQGRDTFVFESLSDSIDTITDFSREDLVDLRNLLGQSQFATVSAFAKFTQFVQLQQVGADTQVQIDTDGIGTGTATTTLAILKNIAVGSVSSTQFLINN